MKNLVRSTVLVALTTAFVMAACTEQHDPRPHWKKFEQERTTANQPVAKLSDEGKLLSGAALAGGKTAAENYQMYCANCHGAEGKGNGPGASTPPPRNFTDKAWQNSVDDAHIAKVIVEGGPAVGLSPMMAPWGAVLKTSEVEDMVAYVRDFAK